MSPNKNDIFNGRYTYQIIFRILSQIINCLKQVFISEVEKKLNL